MKIEIKYDMSELGMLVTHIKGLIKDEWVIDAMREACNKTIDFVLEKVSEVNLHDPIDKAVILKVKDQII